MKLKSKITFMLPFVALLLGCFSCSESDLLDNKDDNTNIETPEEESKPNENLYDSEYLFDIDALPHITVNVSLDEWNNLLSMYDYNPDNEECVSANVQFEKNGEIAKLENIGIRIRGNSSRRRPEGSTGQMHTPNNTNWNHCHFSLKFAEFEKGQTLFGYDRLNLKWHKDDAAYCREIYSYDLFKRFGVWSAPRASYTRLSIHVEGDNSPAYYGVYAMIEPVHKDFLTYRKEKGHLQSDESNLWKASWGADFVDMNDSKIGVEDITLDPSTMKSFVYDLKTNKKKGFDAAKTQLKDFVATLKSKSGTELKNWLELNMDVDLFLKAYAVNVIVGMWDDYWVNTNNFYWYFDGDGKFIFIPYDYDNTLGTSGMMDNSGTQDPMNWGSMDNRPLIAKVFSISEYKERYKQYLQELIDPAKDLFAKDYSVARIKKWQSMISRYVSNDTGEDMSISDIPASWGNCGFYRLLSGNDKGGVQGDANFFATKAASIPK